jgi:ribonucleotide monophosphatase NagD (HAD superfamily)
VVPGNGSLVAAVRAATSVEPLVIGKPECYALDKILEMTKTPRECACMVGDNLATDIAVGNRAGIHTALVLGGITTREQAEAATGDMKPERIINTLGELLI